jgi:hypothetical protein
MRSLKQNLKASVAVETVAAIREELAALRQAIAALAVGREQRASYTLKEFLQRHRLSESQYHKLRREGRGPATMCAGDVAVRISGQAELDWVREREAEARADKEGAAKPRRSSRPRKARAEAEEPAATL